MILVALVVLGIGFILVNLPITILLGYSVSQFEIYSQQIVTEVFGRILFILASIALMVLGLLFILGAVQYYEKELTRGVVFLGALVTSFYLLCIAVGSILLAQETNLDALLMLSGSVIILASFALYMLPSFPLKLGGATLGVLGGVILARVIYDTPVLELVFRWNIPFTGPFMSMSVLEGIVILLAPIAALAHLFSSKNSEGKPLTRFFLSLVALIYGVGLYVGSLVLCVSFWNWIWKSPWIGPFHGMQNWALSTVVFWSASLLLVAIGGVVFVASSLLGFISVAQEIS